MIVYKFLTPGATGRFSGFRWPRPSAGLPGAWVEAGAALRPCAHGIHACRRGDLAHWLDRELWRVELDGERIETASMVVATRGRLLARVAAWDDELAREFGAHCATRARAFAAEADHLAQRATVPETNASAQTEHSELGRRSALARQFAAEVATFAGRGELATAAYVSAVAAHLVSDQPADDAYAAERRAQSAWLAERLKLD